MLAYLFYAVRYIRHGLATLIYRLRTRRRPPPDYVLFHLEGDYPPYPRPYAHPLLRLVRSRRVSMVELGNHFRRIAEDPRVRGVVLHLGALSMSRAKVDSLRELLGDLQAMDKRVVVWAHDYDPLSYYLASAADELLLMPGGTIGGLALRRGYLFMAEALARLGIQADILRVSPYKTAYDTLTRQEMSAEAREMGNWLIESVYEQLVEAIAEGRGIEPEAARGAIDATPCTDLEAQELGLIDALVSEPDLPAHLAEEGAEAAELVTWPKGHRRLRPESPAPPLRYVALMGVEGLIVPGHSQQPPGGPPAPSSIAMQRRAGDRSVVEVARKIAADSRAAAVVLYIDSRGGTSSASEAMRAALQRLADSKPLLVVMGGYAASGGYLVALPGQAVFAQPNTITGSIGVLGGKIASVDLLDRLHANREVITRGEHALFYDFQKPFDPQEREIVRRLIGRTYDLFVEHVAQARELERADVEAMAGGRVWTGRQALDKGLVDEYGGLTHALDLARAQAKLHARAPVRVYHPSKEPTAPRAEPAAAVAYLLEGLSILQRAGSLTLCDLFWDGDDGLL